MMRRLQLSRGIVDGPTLTAPNEHDVMSWAWGADWHLWACRLSHVIGLLAVLVMLVVLGVVSSGW
jgi:hypothetical protein